MTNKLAEIRNKKGITQEKLAQVVGVSRVHIGKIERGQQHGSLKLLIKISQQLGCKLDDIFFGEDDNF